MASSLQLARADILDRFRDRIAANRRSKLSREEFVGLVDSFIEQLRELASPEAIQTLCRQEIQLLEEGYSKLTLASDYIPKYRQAIEAAVAAGQLQLTPENSHSYIHHQRLSGTAEARYEHWALTYFKYTPEEYEALDQRQAQVNRKRLLSLKTVALEPYLTILQDLLQASGQFAARHRAIAIAGLTGRRLGEVIARGQFEALAHPHLLAFSGQQKHDRATYAILTLFPADLLLESIQTFRQMPSIAKLLALPPEEQTVAINTFDVLVNRECDRLFHQTQRVPPLDGKKTVTIHNLRSLWGAIAAYYFCPPDHHEYAFLQQYLGHVLESPATGHYFRYQLASPTGELFREKGVLLRTVPPLPILEDLLSSEGQGQAIEPFHEDFQPLEPVLPSNGVPLSTTDPPAAMIPVTHDSIAPHTLPLHQTPMPLQPSVDPIQALRDEFQQALHTLQQTWTQEWQTYRQTLDAHVMPPSNSQLQPWIPARLAVLEQENLELRQVQAELNRQRQANAGLQGQLQQLQQQNQVLAAQLQEAQSKLDQFRQLLLGNEVPGARTLSESSTVVPKGNLKTQRDRPEPQAKQSSLPLVKASLPQEALPTGLQPVRRGRKPGKALERCLQIFEGIQAWNAAHPNHTFSVNPGLLESIFRVHRKAAQSFCESYQDAIAAYHQALGIKTLQSHNRGKDVEALRAFIEQKTAN
jgi:hypothetical protein